MTAMTNPARERLAKGEVSLGVGLRQARTVDIAPAMKTAGYDWLFIDLEHGTMSEDTAMQVSMAAHGYGIAPIVRVPNGQYDMATRVLADGSCRYDRIPAGYAGDLWIEIIPRSFHVVAQAGVSLNQAIFFRDRRLLGQDELVGIHGCTPLMREPDGSPTPAKRCILDGRLVMTADLDRPVVGWVAKRTHQPLVLSKVAGHAAEDFFTPITRPRAGYQFLEQGRFYILATRERVVVPADLACEMVPYDASAGEFRAHYAGFFDPGFGVIDGKACGATAVLEVRPHEDDLILRHGQPICAMAYERLTRPCTQLYGTRSNTYASQVGPKLSKHFA